MRIAWFSIIPGSSSFATTSKSAYLTKQLVPLLRERGGKEIEIDLYSGKAIAGGEFAAEHYLTALRHHEENPYDLWFYQIEDHSESIFSRLHAGMMPGVVLFHDYLLQTPAPLILAMLDERYDDPQAYREVDQAVVPVFTNPWAHREYLSYREREKHVTSGEGVSSEDASSTLTSSKLASSTLTSSTLIRQPRESRQISFTLPYPVCIGDGVVGVGGEEVADTLTVGIVGSAQTEDRVYRLFHAALRWRQRVGRQKKIRVLWMTQDPEAALRLFSEFCDASLQGGELGCGRLKNEDLEIINPMCAENWGQIVQRSQILCHLRVSAYGALGPYIQASMCSGKPTVVMGYGEGDYYGEQSLIHIRTGETEVSQLEEVLGAFSEVFAAGRGEKFTRGNLDLMRQHDPLQVAADLMEIFRVARPAIEERMREFKGRLEQEVANLEADLEESWLELGWEGARLQAREILEGVLNLRD